MLRLISTKFSPFVRRVTIAARVKGMEIELVPLPQDDTKAPDFLAVNPVGRIPVLLTETGDVIPESETILNYLEDRFPSPAMRPAEPGERARMNTLIRVMDNYVMTPVTRLIPQLNPSDRNPVLVEAEIARWIEGLAVLSHYMSAPLPVAEAGLTLADCALAPSLNLCRSMAAFWNAGDLLAPHSAITAYETRIDAHPIVRAALDEMVAGLSTDWQARGESWSTSAG